MDSGFLTVRKRTLFKLLCTSAIALVSHTANADQFGNFLDSTYSYAVDGPTGDAFAEPLETSGTSDEEDGAGDITKLSEKIATIGDDVADIGKSLEKVEELAGNKSIVVSGSSKSTMKVSGRVHLDGWGFDTDEDPAINDFNGGSDPANRLGFRRIRFGVSGKIKDNMIYKIEMEFAGGNDSEFRDVFLGWIDLPFFQEVLLGNQKRPYGLDHLNSSRYNVFIERPFVIEAFNEDARRLGLQAYGVSDDMAWNWRYGVFNGRNIQDDGNYTGDHLQLQLAGRMANTIWYDETSNGRGYAHWAISGSHADVSTADDGSDGQSESRFRTRPEGRTSSDRWLDTGLIPGADYYNLLGFESVINLGALQIVGEYQSNWVERDGFENVHLNGGYIYASYFLTGEHMPWDRESGTIDRVIPFENFWLVDTAGGGRSAGWGAWQVAARYSQADFNDADIFGGRGESITIGLNWHWNTNARMQFNYISGKIKDRDADNGDNTQTAINATPDVQSGDYDIYGARFMVDF
ncbi:OprO/OprP family phosphate-selective porin [Aporhodopirellula aestuarii]|uniref:OprO/OprP family phosphate-selective porin n=1 Tax=Aporhodopirellula aestuarii TaxID=2950107 RepID=A0ABT0U0G4_9BACT|nr:porin [Aporhodopirellula aestuarii]MCM2370354.1 OprO/OprP family phosphate-selective porin [Aporhodopirellula aestuarii]